MTRMFLFLAYFGCLGRLFMVRNSVCVRMTLLENSGSMYGAAGEGFIRLNIACPRKLLAEGLDRLKRVLTA